MKILCLHGYTQNGSLFAKKASGLRKVLKKAGHELLFIDGPLKVNVNELPFEAPPEAADLDMRAWWTINEADPQYSNTDAAFKAVRQAVDEHGPFDGILGFSQGAGLAAILTKAITQIAPSHPPFKFALIYSGFKLKAASAQHWYDSPFSTPSIHVMGTLDTVVPEERSMVLYDAWDPARRTILKHPGGHYTPSQRPILDAVLGFVTAQTEGGSGGANDIEEKKGKQPQEEDWSAFDSIGK